MSNSLVTNPELEVLHQENLENQTLYSVATAHSELKNGPSSNSSNKLEKSLKFVSP